MYYVLYLSSLCKRRHWPDPLYDISPTSGTSNGSSGSTGYTCVVRVNNREYQTDSVCASESLARESAAMRAYLICRNFSANDGMYPQGHDHGGVVQGIPVAIGTGRSAGKTGGSAAAGYQRGRGGNGETDSSGGSSPESQFSYGGIRLLR